MSLVNDIVSGIAAAAAVGSLVYAAIERHLPRERLPTDWDQPAMPGTALATSAPAPRRRGHRAIPWVLAIVCCVAVTFNWYDQQLNSLPAELPVSSENARITARPEPVAIDDAHQILFNFTPTNVGRATATHLRYTGFLATAGQIIADDTIGPLFIMSKAQLAIADRAARSSIEVSPGHQNLFFTIPNVLPEDPRFHAAWISNDQLLYGFVLIRARDQSIPYNKYIYTEICFYARQRVLHLCESGHNRTYIGD